MAHFAIFAPPLRGHFRPLSILADELIARGHQASFFHQEEARSLVESSAAQFVPIASKASIESWTRPMAKIRGLFGLGETIKRMETFTTNFCREAPSLVACLRVDAIVSDQLEPAGGLIAESLKIPWISIASTIPMNREIAVPPPFVDWPCDRSEKAIGKNKVGWAISDLLLRRFNRTIALNATALGLSGKARIEDCFSPWLQIAQVPSSLDFDRTEKPTSLHYVGPFRRSSVDGPVLPQSNGRPTVYCTLGTLQGSRVGLFRKVAAACDRLGVRLILTHGGLAKSDLAAKLKGNPLVYDWLPQESVMKEVDLVVCHGGMNTVLDALCAARPLLVMPLAFEQPGIAARVKKSKAGLMLPRRSSAKTIALELERLLDDSSYRTHARRISEEIESCGGVRRAADLIEQLLGACVPTGVPTKAYAG